MTILEIINHFFPQESTIDIDENKMLACSNETRLNYSEILNHIPEEKDMKCSSHIHQLVLRNVDAHSSWRCDKIVGAGRCLSGMTSFH